MPETSTPRLLVSFINSVAVMVDDRVFFTHGVICEEVFGVKAELEEKPVERQVGKKRLIDWGFWHEKPPIKATLDFPLYLRVVSLGDGKPLAKIYKLIVKYNNISAIMEL